jgi:hypothetical protein
MSQWSIWEHAFNALTIRQDGDPTEITGATQFALDVRFPNYQVFWRRHLVPATNRPANMRSRPDVAPEAAGIAQVSYGVFCDLVEAERSLIRVRAGDYGGALYQTCVQTLKYDGDAMQKYDDLQRKHVQGALASRLHRPLVVWSPAQWAASWQSRYTKLAAYRNFLTHSGSPQVIIAHHAGVAVPYVPHEDHFVHYQPLAWPDQMKRHQSNTQEWDTFGAVCQRVHDQTIKYLDDTYAEVIKCLDPLVTDEDYQDLWGWDTAKHGTHAGRVSGTPRTPLSSPSAWSGS